MKGSVATAGRPLSLPEEARKAAILYAAERVFDAMGYGGATMEEIARVAGMAKKSVYKFFPDKLSLFGALVETHDLMPVGAAIMAISDEPVHIRIKQLLRALSAYILSPRQIILTRLVISEATTTPEMSRRFFNECVAKTQKYVAAELEREFYTGEKIDIDLHLLADMFIGLTIGNLLLRALMINENIDTLRSDLESRVELASKVMVEIFGQAPPKG
jgi:AcrR family transcriptional regulator